MTQGYLTAAVTS